MKTLRIDNGKEYCNKQMHGYLPAKGISLETTLHPRAKWTSRERQQITG